ncbi:thioredoxin family protein [Pseudorhodobacter sp.]|uniref:thioredoxin family protein n=1 Tax=Pseudorhodobacter sp. TaxID=1934400 RepID=UPI002647EB90|nr:thioredoxin family protein [Pseudorhodobacter sp.]MDN5786776.1 thioredoxin family protein [Pseudorhodobacter sp.]
MKHLLTTLATLIALSLPVHAVELGDDGLHKPTWLRDTFKDMREDLAEANADGKRLLVIWEQRGCIYCTKMHEEVFPDPKIDAMIRDNYFVVQMNLFGDVEVTDFDGTALPEKEMALRWGVVFTPTLMFFPEAVDAGKTAQQAAIVSMPGAFGIGTTLDLLTWVKDKGNLTGEHFQKYHARMITERGGE